MLAWLRVHSQICTVFIMHFLRKGSRLCLLVPKVIFAEGLIQAVVFEGRKQWWEKEVAVA